MFNDVLFDDPVANNFVNHDIAHIKLVTAPVDSLELHDCDAAWDNSVHGDVILSVNTTDKQEGTGSVCRSSFNQRVDH